MQVRNILCTYSMVVTDITFALTIKATQNQPLELFWIIKRFSIGKQKVVYFPKAYWNHLYSKIIYTPTKAFSLYNWRQWTSLDTQELHTHSSFAHQKCFSMWECNSSWPQESKSILWIWTTVTILESFLLELLQMRVSYSSWL